MEETVANASPSREASLSAYRARVTRALAYIQENLADEASLDGAAEAACFSKFHFHRIFSAAMGESFADCVRRLRLERAANLLELRPAMSVTDAAMASGFGSASVLSRLFAERFGSPPSRWRQERLAAGASAATSRRVDDAAGPGLELWTRSYGDGVRDALSTRSMPALRFASCLHIGAYGPGIAEAWDRLYRWAGPRGLVGPSTETAGVSWDNPDLCAADSCRYSACIGIPDGVEGSGDVVILSFPARRYLCLHYEGSDARFSAAYSELYRRYLPESGFEPEDDPAIEFHHKPASAETGFDLDIAIPVRPLY